MISVIHMGAATGSSTLQEFFPQPRAVARCRRVLPGQDSSTACSPKPASTRRANRTRTAERATARSQAFAKEIARDARGMDSLLVSSELLHARLWNAGEIERLKALLELVFVVIVFYAQQDRYGPAPRHYRRGAESDALLETLNPHHFAYGHPGPAAGRVRRRGDAGRACSARPRWIDGDIAADFIAASGLPLALADCQHPADRNAAFSADAQWFLREFNRRRPRVVEASDDGRRAAPQSRGLPRGAGRRPARAAGARIGARVLRRIPRGERRGGAALVRARGAVRRIVRRYHGSRGQAHPDAMDIAAPLLRRSPRIRSSMAGPDRRQRLADAEKSNAALLAALAGFVEECDPALAQRLREAGRG
ncbi:MAG: hypothetical protein U1F20_03245 [Lysobacterales bacterium]